MQREAKYKPFLMTTTIRNPERLKSFLAVLKRYDGEVLSDKLAEEICGEIISEGLYMPMNVPMAMKKKIASGKPLSKKERLAILAKNPQNHKEAGFEKGWPSRFDTWFKMGKELGFAFYAIGEKIRFSSAGNLLIKLLIDSLVKPDELDYEQSLFMNALIKYQSNNPFRRVKNENVPLVLLMQVISKLNADPDFSDAGVSKLELPLLIYWKNSDAEALFQRIKQLRRDFGYTPSWETIIDICQNEIMEGCDIRRNPKSIMVDYPDEFIRKMRLTGLISLRGNGRFVDINKNEIKKIGYILKNYSEYEKYRSEKSYFNHIARVDKKIVTPARAAVPAKKQDQFVQKWADSYGWDGIKREILVLSVRNRSSSDEMLKYLSEPVRLEFLTALAIKARFPNVQVMPNYPVDDEGVPTSTAGGAGDTGDIECMEKRQGILVEVTMSEGTTQTRMEIFPIRRHLAKFRQSAPGAECYFVAPSIFSDSVDAIGYVKYKYDLNIHPKTIREFVDHLESSASFYPADA